MRPRSPMPVLAVPFAIVGAAAGWLGAGLAASPLVDVVYRRAQPIAAAVGLVAGAVVGRMLSRRYAPRPGELDGVPIRRLIVAVPLAGTVAGAAVCVLTIGWPSFVYRSAIAGLVTGLAFLPICALVLGAARRAARARFGSIVAGADRRAVWAILAASLAATTLAGVFDWPAHTAGEGPAPYAALALAVGAAAVCAAAFGADALAVRAVRAAASAALGMEARDASEALRAPAGVPSVDLGVGNEVMARVARARDAYRGIHRATALLVGNAEEAEAALVGSRRRAAAGLGVAAVALGFHAVGALGGADLVYELARCDQGAGERCHAAAMRIEADHPGRANLLYERACRDGVDASCSALVARSSPAMQ